MPNRVRIYSGAPWEQIVGYCRAMRVGDHIVVSGTTAMKDGQPVAPGDAAAQTRFILQTIAGVLEQAGASIADVVRYRVYVTDISTVEQVTNELARVFQDVHPTSTLVEVSGLIRPELVVEIEVDAIAGSAAPVGDDWRAGAKG